MLHAYLSICWIDEIGELPPVHIKNLLLISNNRIKEFYEDVQSGWIIKKLPNELFEVKKREIDKKKLLKDMDKNYVIVRELIKDVRQAIENGK